MPVPLAPIVVLLPLVEVSVLAVPVVLLLEPDVPDEPVVAPALGVVVLLDAPVVPPLAPLVPLVLGDVVVSVAAGAAVLPDEVVPLVEPAVPLPDVCATDKPPKASAAAAARVVRVFLVVIMSYSLKWKPRRGIG